MHANIAEVILLVLVLIRFECSTQTENEVLSVPMSARSHKRSREASCQSLCIANEVNYLKRCITVCSGKENPDKKALMGKQVLGIRMRNSAITQSSKTRRDVNEDCTSSSISVDYKAREVPGLRVDFTRSKPNLSVAWDPIKDFQPNWTSYALLYWEGSLKQPRKCKLVPKHQHEWTITHGDGWWYPNSIFLLVVTFPFSKSQGLEFKEFGKTLTDPEPITSVPPTEPKRPLPPTVITSKSPAKLVGAVAGGSAAGFLLLLVVMIFFRKEISGFLCSGHSGVVQAAFIPFRVSGVEDDHREHEIGIPLRNSEKATGSELYYACYFPESDVFKAKIADIVNHYREDGYQVVMDLMDSSGLFNLGPTRWAEQQIKRARKILVFLSPGLLRLSAGHDGKVESTCQESERVWYELYLLQRIHTQTRSAGKMVCISFSDLPVDHLDLPLWAELRYTWPADDDKILKRLNDKPMLMPL